MSIISRNFRVTRRTVRKSAEEFIIEHRVNILDKPSEEAWRTFAVFSTFAKADAYLAKLHREARK